MQIKINRVDDAYLMGARNESDHSIQMDGSTAIGGGDQAFRPMQTVLAALGSCSTIDIISILKKQRQELKDIHITLDADREEEAVPPVFKKIHVHYDLYGDLNEQKVKRAIELSLYQYCSVAKMLEKSADITYDFAIHEFKE